MMDVESTLRTIALFHGLDGEQLRAIVALSEKKNYRQQETIFDQGEAGDAMYLVASGQVEILVKDNSGSAHAAVYLGEGQVFGEMALIDDAPRSAAVVAVEDGTTVYRLATEAFTALCQSNLAIGYIMMRNIAQDLSFKLRHQQFGPC